VASRPERKGVSHELNGRNEIGLFTGGSAGDELQRRCCMHEFIGWREEVRGMQLKSKVNIYGSDATHRAHHMYGAVVGRSTAVKTGK